MTMNRCEDFPCCGHEAGDCNGALYGSDEDIKAQVERAWDTGHGYCDHENGLYNCEDDDEDEEEGEDLENELDDTPYLTEDYDPRNEEVAAEYDDYY